MPRFPKAKVIWVLRDEEEIVQSLLRRQRVEGEAFSDLTEETARELVRAYNEAATTNIKNSGVEVRMVQYKDLVSSEIDTQRKSWFSLYQFCQGPSREDGRLRKAKSKIGHNDLLKTFSSIAYGWSIGKRNRT